MQQANYFYFCQISFLVYTYNIMVDTFLAIPESTSPLTPIGRLILDDVATSLITAKPALTYPYVTTVNSGVIVRNQPFGIISSNIGFPLRTNTLFYHDSGIGDNPIVIHNITSKLRYKFLDKWLYDDCEKILKLLKIRDGKVTVLSSQETEKNDISKDTNDDLMKKSDFIGYEILPLRKTAKILRAFAAKNNIKFYDIPYNESYVKRSIIKYVFKKLSKIGKN